MAHGRRDPDRDPAELMALGATALSSCTTVKWAPTGRKHRERTTTDGVLVRRACTQRSRPGASAGDLQEAGLVVPDPPNSSRRDPAARAQIRHLAP